MGNVPSSLQEISYMWASLDTKERPNYWNVKNRMYCIRQIRKKLKMLYKTETLVNIFMEHSQKKNKRKESERRSTDKKRKMRGKKVRKGTLTKKDK